MSAGRLQAGHHPRVWRWGVSAKARAPPGGGAPGHWEGLLALQGRAQEGPPKEDPPPPALTSKTYDLTGLLDLDRVAKTADGISPDAVFSEIDEPVEETLWNVRNQRDGARCWFSADGALPDGHLPATEHPLNPPNGGPRIRVTRGGVWW